MPKELNQNEQMVVGTILDTLPNTTYRIELEDGRLMIAYLSGRMKRFRIKVLIGDKVEIVTDSSAEKGRVVKRL
jgi:translation initiation factor IF-1